MTMTSPIRVKTKSITVPSRMIEAMFEELRLLRSEITLLFPHEDLEGYAHPERIKQSYRNAMKRYPSTSV